MATVPTVTGPSVQRSPIPDAYQRAPQALGADAQARAQQFGQAARAVGQVADFYKKVQDEADRSRVDDAVNKLLERDTDLTFGDAGFTKLRGESALKPGPSGVAPVDDYAQQMRQSASELGTGLTPRQRQAFELKANDIVTAFRRRAAAHVGQEQSAFQDATDSARIEQAHQRMTLAGADMEMAGRARADILDAVGNASRRMGASPEMAAAAAVRALSPGHAAVLSTAIDAGNLDFARSYLQQSRGEMLPAAVLHAQKALDIGTADAKEQALADGLWGKHQGNAEAALAEARQTLQGKEEDGVVQRLKILDTERKTFEDRSQRTAYEAALLRVQQGQRVPPSLLVAMGEGHAASVLEHQRARAKAAEAEAAGRPVRTDWTLYLSLREQAANEPEKFAALDLKRYVDRIGGPQLEQLADLKSKIDKPGKTHEAATLTQQMNATMAAVGITKAAQKGQFLAYVQAEVDTAMQANGGKPLPFDERQKIIDRALLRGPDPDRVLPWGERFMFQLNPDQRQRFKPNAATDAPASEIDAINDALRRQGLPQTPANRLQLYQRATAGKR